MYSRKPKNIVSKVIELTSGLDTREASHTWMGKDQDRSANFGSTSQVTFEQRRQADRDRRLVARYADSQISQTARTNRGNLARATRSDSDNNQSEQTEQLNTIERPPQIGPASGAQSPAAFYPDFRPKL